MHTVFCKKNLISVSEFRRKSFNGFLKQTASLNITMVVNPYCRACKFKCLDFGYFKYS